MAVAGLFLGWKGQGPKVDTLEVGVAIIWAAAIGFGFGSIFDQRPPRRLLVVYWAATLALVAAFFAPLLPVSSFFAQEASAATIGALVGVAVGFLHGAITRGETRTSNRARAT